MGIGVSLFLIAAGAILTFAVETEAEGVNINTVGIILMVVGAIGILLTLLVFGDRRGSRSDERTVIRDREI